MAAGVSQDDLSLSAGLDRGYVSRVERATANVTIATMEKLADALAVHISELLREPPKNAKLFDPLRGGRPSKVAKS